MDRERSYMYQPLKIGNLIAKIPIIQGGMGIGISLSNLSGAVALEGGIGVISTAQIGFREEDFSKHPLEANLRMIGEHIKRARMIAPKGILGVNIMVATNNYKDYVLEAVKSGIDLIISGAGLPLELPSLVAKSKTKIAPIVSSKKAAELLLKMWDKKDQTTADAIIIEGPLAGGHLGFHLDYLENSNAVNYDDEIIEIIKITKQYEEKYEKEIPVIVAGGIENQNDLDHVLSLGASGIQVGTKFVTTVECDAHSNYKEAYLNSKQEDIVFVKSPVGMPGRAIMNPFVQRSNLDRIPVKACHNCIKSCNPKTTPYCITDALMKAAKGEVDDGLIFCGAYAYKEDKIRTVKDVIEDFIGKY